MKKRALQLCFAGLFAVSCFLETEAQNPYNLLMDSTYLFSWDITHNDWILSQKESYKYVYSSGNQLVETDQFDNNGNLIRIESISYSDTTTERIIKNPYNGNWLNWLKYFTLYDNSHKEIYSETYTWVNNEWVRADKVIYVYDGDTLVQLIRQYQYNGIFQDILQIDYLYDQSSHLSEYVVTDLIYKSPLRRILFTYNSINQRTEGIQQNWQNGWSNSGKIVYSYNDCGRLSEIVNQDFSNNVFVNSTKSQFFYSPHFFESKTKKVAICHNGHTIYVSINAVRAHLAHGDCIGECAVENKSEDHRFKDRNKIEKPPFTIYPNPARDKIIIKFEDDEYDKSRRLELTDFYGKLIRSFNIKDNNDLIINRGNLINGKYYIRLIGKEIYSAVIIFK